MEARLGIVDELRAMWRRRRHPERVSTEAQELLAYQFPTSQGRTLPEGMQWCGKDNPGGAAARRRLRQQARVNAARAMRSL